MDQTPACRSISRFRKALATTQSRFTVAVEICRTSAVSSIVSPASPSRSSQNSSFNPVSSASSSVNNTIINNNAFSPPLLTSSSAPRSPPSNGSSLLPAQLEQLLSLPLQQLYWHHMLQTGLLNKSNNVLESLVSYQKLLEMQNALNLLPETGSGGGGGGGAPTAKLSDNGGNAGFVEFRARECGFCKSNKETREFYTSHYLKNAEGHVVCPILSKYTCPYCQATGIYAHTKGYCPKKPPSETGYNQFRNADKFVKSTESAVKFRNSCADKVVSRDTLLKHRVF